MSALNSYERMIQNPGIGPINWYFLTLHPEAKAAVWARFNNDALFRKQIEKRIVLDSLFKRQFEECFGNFKGLIR